MNTLRTTVTSVEHNGTTLTRGTRVRISGEPGRFSFRSAELSVATGNVLWVTVYGGSEGRRSFRSFPLAKVRMRKLAAA